MYVATEWEVNFLAKMRPSFGNIVKNQRKIPYGTPGNLEKKTVPSMTGFLRDEDGIAHFLLIDINAGGEGKQPSLVIRAQRVVNDPTPPSATAKANVPTSLEDELDDFMRE